LHSITFFLNRAVYEIKWENIVQPGRPQMIIWRMGIACWIPKAKNTHSQYVILVAFPLQQWLQERASILRYTYIARLVKKCHNPICHTVRLKDISVLLHITTLVSVTKSWSPKCHVSLSFRIIPSITVIVCVTMQIKWTAFITHRSGVMGCRN
jgi:hypothetical protein